MEAELYMITPRRTTAKSTVRISKVIVQASRHPSIPLGNLFISVHVIEMSNRAEHDHFSWIYSGKRTLHVLMALRLRVYHFHVCDSHVTTENLLVASFGTDDNELRESAHIVNWCLRFFANHFLRATLSQRISLTKLFLPGVDHSHQRLRAKVGDLPTLFLIRGFTREA